MSDRPLVRRIVVALGTPAATVEALSAAAVLAERTGAQLEGIFVEDVDVLRAAGLPFTSQLSLPSGECRPLDLAAVEAELRAVAAAAREALSAVAAAHGVRASFRVTRGRIRIELLEASYGADLLVVGRNGRAVRGARPELAAPSGPRRRATPANRLPVGDGSTLRVAYDGSPAADHALDIGVQLGAGAPVELLVPATSAAEADQVAERARARHPHQRIEARWAGGPTWLHLVAAARGTTGPLVLPARIEAVTGVDPETMFQATAAPLLIVR